MAFGLRHRKLGMRRPSAACAQPAASCVTLDQVEAMTRADRIALLRPAAARGHAPGIAQPGRRCSCTTIRPIASSPASSVRRR
jgi:hypothetical protein